MEEENVPEQEVKRNPPFIWRLLELRPNREEVQKRSEETFKCEVDTPGKEMRFKLVLCIKQELFSIWIENLEEHDIHLKVVAWIRVLERGGMFKKQEIKQYVATKAGTKANELMYGRTRELFIASDLWESQDFHPPEVHIIIKILVPIRYSKPNFWTSIKNVKSSSSLVNDLKSAFDNELYADLTVICMDNEDDTTSSNDKKAKVVEKARFKVQRAILASRSKVFASMFFGNFSETNSNTLTISDMSPRLSSSFCSSCTQTVSQRVRYQWGRSCWQLLTSMMCLH